MIFLVVEGAVGAIRTYLPLCRRGQGFRQDCTVVSCTLILSPVSGLGFGGRCPIKLQEGRATHSRPELSLGLERITSIMLRHS